MPSDFYRDFSDRQKSVTDFGKARRNRTEQSRLGLLMRHASPGTMLEIGPGQGSLAQLAVSRGWTYRAMEASEILIGHLRGLGLEIIEGWAPPILAEDASTDVIYADQVLEHMTGIDAAREFVAEARRVLRPGGVLFVVVPDYLKERTFFWDVDYTHNFVTTERRVRQLFNDGGFDILHVERSIGVATGVRRDALAAGALLINLPGVNALSRYTKSEDLVFKIRKNLFETLTFV